MNSFKKIKNGIFVCNKKTTKIIKVELKPKDITLIEPIEPQKIPIIEFARSGKPESLTKSALFFSFGIIFFIFIFRKLKSRKNNNKNV